MSSVDRLIKLADRFARKIVMGQALVGEDPKAVVADAFFGPRQETDFQNFILQPNSNFSKTLPESVKTVSIGAIVSAKTKSAAFLVTPQPGTPALALKLKAALREDYKAKYGSYPEQRFAERLAKNDIKPADIELSAPGIITIS